VNPITPVRAVVEALLALLAIVAWCLVAVMLSL
jgi:hypothetical protein